MFSPTPPIPTGDSRSLNRFLKSRHLAMISIGSTIDTDLFVASGVIISSADPGEASLACGFIGFMAWLIMQSPGEMVAFLPVSGSLGEYGRCFMSPSLGSVIGQNYWFDWVITVVVELVATALVMKCWFPHVPSTLWSGLFLLILFGINALSTKAHGESEFWFVTIKVLTVIVFLILGLAMILGIIGEAPGTQGWTAGEVPSVGGAESVFLAILAAEYSFQGTKLVGIAAGKAEDSGYTIPRAICTIFWRIFLFYVGAVAVIGFLTPYADPSLLNSSGMNISVNPFTLVLDKVGILAIASLMNAAILTSVLSAGTSDLYASIRMLFALAEKDHASRFLKKFSEHQVPVDMLLAMTFMGLAGFITSLAGDGKVYGSLLTVSALTGSITWMGISWSHYRFRKTLAIQNISLNSLPYHTRFFPAGAAVALVVCVLIVVGQSCGPLRDGVPLDELLLPFTGTPLLLALWVGHKLVMEEPVADPATADLGYE